MAQEPLPTSVGSDDAELQRVGKYELLSKIGKGGMGVVYRGRDTVLNRMVAVKMLVSDIDVSEETRERFFREARSAGQLAHRNIITIYDFGEENGRAYIVMELLNGESLTSVLARPDRLPLEQQVEVMARVCEGLAFAHARGIVHRDVKPANLFLTVDGQIKVLDFGVARIASSKLTRSGLIVGTPDYMSPEQVMGKVVDQRSDVFSAGAVFYQLLSGRKPFGAKTLPQILNRVMAEQPPALTDAEAPPELAAIVMKALEKDPAKRYQRMVEMMAALAKFLQGWDRQTRELAVKACDLYQQNAKLIEARKAAGGADEEVAAAPFLRDLPLFQDRGAEVLKVVPFRRARILEMLDALQAQHARLTAAGPSPA
jgi:serine/threonine-protein kinase